MLVGDVQGFRHILVKFLKDDMKIILPDGIYYQIYGKCTFVLMQFSEVNEGVAEQNVFSRLVVFF